MKTTHSNVPFLPLGSPVIPPKNSSVFGNTVSKLFLFVIVVCFIVYIMGTTDSITPDYTPVPQEQPNFNDTITICKEYYNDSRQYIQDRSKSDYEDLPYIYFVTPTYPRREQTPEILRLGYTLMHIPKIHWIVANDYDQCDSHLDSLLMEFGIPFTHISSPMNDIYRHLKNVPRGVANRRAALNWIKVNNKSEGVLYFGDDDNTFHLKLFSEIRHTKKVSMFPVGLIGNYAVSSPVVRDSKVIGFLDSWIAGREWAVDMAGFAVNLEYLFKHKDEVTMPYKAGYEEDKFLKSLKLRLEDVEPKARNCTEILVYHTQTKKTKSPDINFSPIHQLSSPSTSNIGHLFRFMESAGISHFTSSKGIKPEVSYKGKKLPASKVY